VDTHVSALLAEALSLPDEERLELAEALLSSVAPSDALPFDPEWLDEAKRRAARLDSGEGKLSDWSEVRERANRRMESLGGG
jgi:putative addiction module component (TIGR02574 family)